MSRRDDLWSWYFVALDFLGEELEWRTSKHNNIDDVKLIKAKCIAEPEKYLWKTTTREMTEMKDIFNDISKLRYADKPDYNFIQEQLSSLLERVDELEPSITIVPLFFDLF